MGQEYPIFFLSLDKQITLTAPHTMRFTAQICIKKKNVLDQL